ncbi:MAG: response regulator transcription factor [Oscillospiraceae bacterium]|nr:response regulator transcription factor [Oscillospiraceae bacterium]
MIGEREYQRLLKLQSDLLTIYLNEPYDELGTQRILQLLDKNLGYSKSLMGFTGNVGERSFAPNITTHGVDMRFVQDFMSEIWAPYSPYDHSADLWVFSQTNGYKKRDIFKNVLKPQGLADCMVLFLKPPTSDGYIAYIVLFAENAPFSEDNIEEIRLISESLAITEDNYVKIWNLKNEAKMLLSCTNYFPLGIMIIENLTNVTFVNDLAKEYLKELGFSDPRFYNAFYVNEIYKLNQHNILNFGSSKPIRIKRFLFSVLSLSNPGKSLTHMGNLMEGPQHLFQNGDNGIHYRDMTTCVYIVCDKEFDTNTPISDATLKRLGLTNRECQMIDYITIGLSNQEIAEKMFISVNTVKIHISNIFRKVNVKSRVELLDKLYKLEREG